MQIWDNLHGPSVFAGKAKIYGVLYDQYSSIAFYANLVFGQRQKVPNCWAFHWSPHGSLVSIGQHFVTMRVVHLPKRTNLITEADLITESDQAVRVVHNCDSWFGTIFCFILKLVYCVYSLESLRSGDPNENTQHTFTL